MNKSQKKWLIRLLMLLGVFALMFSFGFFVNQI